MVNEALRLDTEVSQSCEKLGYRDFSELYNDNIRNIRGRLFK